MISVVNLADNARRAKRTVSELTNTGTLMSNTYHLQLTMTKNVNTYYYQTEPHIVDMIDFPLILKQVGNEMQESACKY